MGFAADCEYASKYGSTGNATQAIITNWNTACALYKVSYRSRPMFRPFSNCMIIDDIPSERRHR